MYTSNKSALTTWLNWKSTFVHTRHELALARWTHKAPEDVSSVTDLDTTQRNAQIGQTPLERQPDGPAHSTVKAVLLVKDSHEHQADRFPLIDPERATEHDLLHPEKDRDDPMTVPEPNTPSQRTKSRHTADHQAGLVQLSHEPQKEREQEEEEESHDEP
jgi:hypothetical protein